MTRSFQAIVSGFACGLMLAAGSLAGAAYAQDTRSEQQRICGHDVSRHCRRQINDGDWAVQQCLQQNRERISVACRRLLDGH